MLRFPLYSGERRIQTLFALMVAFALLGPTLGIPVTPNFNLTLFRLTFFLLVALLLIHWVNRNTLEAVHMYRIRWYPAFFGFWLAYAAVSLTWASNLYWGIRYTIFLAMMAFLCLAFPFFIRSEAALQRIVRTLFWTFFVIIAFGVFESVTFFHLPSSRYWGQDSASVTSFFHNQNDLATAITLLLPFLATYLHMVRGRLKQKGLVYVTIVFSLYCLLATGSRVNTFFALPLMFIAWLVSLPFTVPREKLLNRGNLLKGVGVIASIAILVGILYIFLLDEDSVARYKLASTFGIFLDIQGAAWDVDELDAGIETGAGTKGISVVVRWYLLLYGLKFLQESHYMGVGAGNVEVHMEKYLAQGINKINIHNWWAEILVNFGVIIFILYIILYMGLLWRLWKLARLKTSPRVSPLVRWGALSSLLSLIGYIFGGIAPSTAIHFTPMWIVYGIALAVVAVGERQQAQPTATRSLPPNPRRETGKGP